jgi:hypothetical protein
MVLADLTIERRLVVRALLPIRPERGQHTGGTQSLFGGEAGAAERAAEMIDGVLQIGIDSKIVHTGAQVVIRQKIRVGAVTIAHLGKGVRVIPHQQSTLIDLPHPVTDGLRCHWHGFPEVWVGRQCHPSPCRWCSCRFSNRHLLSERLCSNCYWRSTDSQYVRIDLYRLTRQVGARRTGMQNKYKKQ